MTTVKLHLLQGLNHKGKAKAEAVCALLEKTINTPAFQQAVLTAKFSDIRLEQPDNGPDRTDLTNQEILDILLSGVEYKSPPDGEIGLKVKFHPFGSAIGSSKNGEIDTLRRFFNRSSLAQVAGHWLHEWCHVAGFHHDYARTARRPNSVPYLIGSLLAKHAGGKFDLDEENGLAAAENDDSPLMG